VEQSAICSESLCDNILALNAENLLYLPQTLMNTTWRRCDVSAIMARCTNVTELLTYLLTKLLTSQVCFNSGDSDDLEAMGYRTQKMLLLATGRNASTSVTSL